MTRDDIRSRFAPAEVAALTTYGEAAGEPIEGQVAVLNVLRNRAVFRGWSVTDVALEPLQFSCWWQKGANTDRLFDVATTAARGIGQMGPVLRQIWYLATGFEYLLDNTHGATHYVTKTLWESGALRPTWLSADHPVLATIGGHVFFDNIAPYITKR